MKIYVAHLLGSLNRGGTETLMLDVFRNAQKSGFNPICIYRKSGALENDFKNCGIPIYKLPFSKNIIIYANHLKKIVKENNIHIIHTHQPVDAIVAKLLFLFKKIKVVLTVHEYDFSFTGLSKLLLHIALKITVNNIFVSNGIRDYYTKKYHLDPMKQTTIYNGISFDKFNVNVENSIRAELGIPTKSLLMGAVGNFNPVRDQLTICRFLSLLNNQNVDFRFLFIGYKSPAYPERYEECVTFIIENNLQDKVFFLGSRKDVPNILKQLNAFIYSSDHDTFGIAVVEALACQIPTFVNDWGIMREITDNGELATLYLTKNETDLLHKFIYFINNQNDFYEKSLMARNIVLDKFSIKNHIEKLKLYYSSLILISNGNENQQH